MSLRSPLSSYITTFCRGRNTLPTASVLLLCELKKKWREVNRPCSVVFCPGHDTNELELNVVYERHKRDVFLSLECVAGFVAASKILHLTPDPASSIGATHMNSTAQSLMLIS